MFKMIVRLFAESIGYTFLLILTAAIMMYGVKSFHANGSVHQAPSYCEDDTGHLMRVKEINSIDESGAKLQMEDNSIITYRIREYIRGYKGGGTVRHTSVKVNDYICIKK